jgi:hypothetical protein
MAKQVGPATAGGVAASGAGYGASAGVSAGTGAGHDVIPFVSQVPGTPVTFPSFHGRTVSWIAVSVIMAAFLLGGLALVFGPTWWLFWVSLGIAAAGTLVALATGIFDDWY